MCATCLLSKFFPFLTPVITFHNFVLLIKFRVSRLVANEQRENKAGIKHEWPREVGSTDRNACILCTCRLCLAWVWASACVCVSVRKTSYARRGPNQSTTPLNEGDARIYMCVYIPPQDDGGSSAGIRIPCEQVCAHAGRQLGHPEENQPHSLSRLPERISRFVPSLLTSSSRIENSSLVSDSHSTHLLMLDDFFIHSENSRCNSGMVFWLID